jgi:hypothetical protein
MVVIFLMVEVVLKNEIINLHERYERVGAGLGAGSVVE